ncbi:MAG: anti-sigma factor family protein [Kiloniellales bacterium]
MSDQQDNNNDRDFEVEQMLPWYVNGTLTADERETVEAYLAQVPEARDEVAFLRRLRDEVKAKQPVTTPGEFGLKRLQRQVEQERAARWRGAGLWRAAAIAAALVILVQGAVLFQTWRNGGDFIVAGTDDASAVVLQMTFDPQATEAEIRQVLQTVDAHLVSGPGALGVYRVVLEDVALDDEAAIRQAMKTLRGFGSVVTEVVRP